MEARFGMGSTNLLLPVWFLILFVAIQGCEKGFNSKTGEATSQLLSVNTTVTTMTLPQPNTLLKKVKMQFWAGTSASGVGLIKFPIYEGEEYRLFFTVVPIPMGTSPLMLFVDDAVDSPENITSLTVLNSADQSVGFGGCSQTFGCRFGWSQISTTKICEQGDDPVIYPTPGTYRLIAGYRDNTTRKIEFKISDPCATLISRNLTKGSKRIPASIKPKKK